jgi:hypothetical protein
MTTNPPSLPVVPGGRPTVLCTADCQKCAKRGLPFVAVIDTVVDAGHAQHLANAGHRYPAAFDAEFAALKRQTTVPAARLPGAGFVWMLFEDIGRWDVWQTFADGSNRLLLQKVSAQDYAKQSPGLKPTTDDMVCARGAANLGAGFFTISGAISHRSVWLAYSAHLWAPQVLADYTTDAHGQRSTRMTHVLAKAWVNGGAQPSNSMTLSEAALKAHVAEYADLPAGGANVSPNPSLSPVVRGFENASRRFQSARLGRAKDMASHAGVMEQAAGQACKDRALIIRLRDDIGVAEELNHLRLLAADLKKAWAIGGPDWEGKDGDPVRAWKLTSSLHVDTIEQWAQASANAQAREAMTRAHNKNIPPVTEEDFQRRMTDGTYPDGTTWQPLHLTRYAGGVFPPRTEVVTDAAGQPVAQTIASTRHPGQQTRLGRVQVPSQWVKASADPRAQASGQARLERYRKKIALTTLNGYRSTFQAASERWDREYISLFDADCVSWRESVAMQRMLSHDFDHRINLCQPSAASGSVAQQVDDVIARVCAIDKAWGGGALSAASAQELRKLLDKDAANATNWLTQALVKPFDALDEISSDKDKQKDSAESFKGLLELPATVRQALAARGDKRLEESLHGVLATRLHAVQLKAAALQEQSAKAMGVAQSAPARVLEEYKLHVRLSALMDEVVNPGNPLMSFRVQLPIGAALDEISGALMNSTLPVKLQTKSSSQRTERRQQQIKLRKLEGRPGLDVKVDYPVLLRRDDLQAMLREAQRSGERTVTLVPDRTLGTLSRAIELPDSVARKLVANQISTGRQWAKAALSLDGLGSGVVAAFQVAALMYAMTKIDNAQGYEYTDALMSILSASSGLVEVAATLGALVYQVKAQAGRTVLASTVTRAAALRLVAGVAGAGAAGFDAMASWAKRESRRAHGDRAAATQYAVATGLYASSTFAVTLGSFTMWKANAALTTEQMAKSLALRYFGGRAAAMAFGSWMTGIGVLLSVAGFGWALYALSLEDDLNEVFLKRSFWGTKDPQEQRSEGRFSSPEAEREAFQALAIGIKASLEWNDNWVSADGVTASVEFAEWHVEHTLRRSLSFSGAAGGLPEVRDRPALEADEATGRLKFSVTVPIPSGATTATFRYALTDATGRVVYASDTLNAKDD